MKRRPAEPLYMGSTPIPGFYTEPLYSNVIIAFLWALRRKDYKESTMVQNYASSQTPSKALQHN